MRPDLSIIIASWNTKELLENCLKSLEENRGELKIEIIVVDNHSTDSSVDFLKTKKEIKTIFNKKNLGFAKANNQGIKISQGKYILLLNSDTIVKEKSLEKLVNYLEKNKEAAAVSPMLLNPDQSQQIEYYMKFPNPGRVFLFHTAPIRLIIMKTWLKRLILCLPEKTSFEVDQLPGAALMSRKKVFERLDLDEGYAFLFEDVDWCYQVKKADWGKLMVLPESEIIHIGGASWKKKVKKDSFSFYQQYFNSLLLFAKKHFPEKVNQFKLAIKVSALINSLAHFLTLNPKKALVQAKIVLTI